jgi:hypothetical protein
MAEELIPKVSRVLCKKGVKNGHDTLERDEPGTYQYSFEQNNLVCIILDKDKDIITANGTGLKSFYYQNEFTVLAHNSNDNGLILWLER